MQGISVTLGHSFEATIYKKHGKSYISEEGRELEIIDYTPSAWSPAIQVVQRGVYHCPVRHKPTKGVYNGKSPLWRISHNISRFATQIERLKTLLPSPEHQLELDLMIEEISDGFHDASSEISRLNSKLIGVIQSSNSSGKIVVGREGADDELLVEKKKVDDFAKLMKYRESETNGLPILHYACLEGMNPFIIDTLVQKFGIESLKSKVMIGKEQIRNVSNFSGLRFSHVFRAAPIHLAILCDHISLVQHLIEHYPVCVTLRMRYEDNYGVSKSSSFCPPTGEPYRIHEVSAFASLPSFQLMRERRRTDYVLERQKVVQMALLGGNLKLIQHLPTFYSVDFEELFRKDHGLLWQYWYLAARGGHLPLIEWIFKNFNRFSAVEPQTSSSGNDGIIHGTADQFHSLEYRKSFWEWSKFEEDEIINSSIDHLPIVQWICQSSSTQQSILPSYFSSLQAGEGVFINGYEVPRQCTRQPSSTTKDECYHVMFKSNAPLWAAQKGSEDVFLWLSKSPHFTEFFLRFGNTAAHGACTSDFGGILQILCDWAWENRRDSNPNLRFFHLRDKKNNHIAHTAAVNGSLNCLQWMTDHLEEFKGRKGHSKFLALKGENGMSVLHCAAKSGNPNVLAWLHEIFEPNWTLEDDIGYQPIHYACTSLSGLLWFYKTAESTNLDVLTKDGHHLAWLAASEGNFEVLDFIVSKVGPSGLTRNEPSLSFAPVANCIQNDPIRLLEWLRKVGCNFSLVDQNGDTFAHRIASITSSDAHLIALDWLKIHTSLTFLEENNSKKTVLNILSTSSKVNALHLAPFILKHTPQSEFHCDTIEIVGQTITLGPGVKLRSDVIKVTALD